MNKIKTEWDLTIFYESLQDPKLISDVDDSVNAYNDLDDKYNGKIDDLSIHSFKRFLHEESEAGKGLVKASLYVSYTLNINNKDQEALTLYNKLSSIHEELSNKMLFLDDFYNNLGYDKIIELSNVPELEEFKSYLVSIAETRKYSIGSKETQIALYYTNVINEAKRLYDDYTMAIEFEEGLSKSELYSMRESSYYEVRKKSNEILYKAYKDTKTQTVLSSIYSMVCKENVASMKVFKYENIMTSNLVNESMDLETVNKLIENVKSKYNIYHNYLSKKEEAMGKKMTWVDILAPVGLPKGELVFEEALDIYMRMISTFDEELAIFSKSMFENGQVDVFPGKNKRSGAFSSSHNDLPSMISMNYTNDITSLFTLTHEMGHSIHGHLSQGINHLYDAPLPLAETASIFNETLLYNFITNEYKESELEYYRFKYLDNIFGTMFRQIMYTDFEIECNTRTLNGEVLSYTDLNNIWMTKTKELYSDYIEIPEYVSCGWSIVPHITCSPFYCYSYSFGNILAFSLYDKFLNDNSDEFINMYKDILSSGGTTKPYDLLMKHGIDINGDKFYNDAFSYLEKLIESL